MASSRTEVRIIFPSITHEGIPLAAEILRKLRAGTAPGKGAYLKPEETAALPGVSAFLAVERLQTHDLTIDEARKRCSVSAPHFKACLVTARQVLAEASQLSTPTKRSTRSSPSIEPTASAANAQAMADLTAKLVSTPSKKRSRPGPSRDLSGLLDRTPTKPKDATPVKPSPLKQSTTPSKAPRSARRAPPPPSFPGEDEEDEEEEEIEIPSTPSKRFKFSNPTPGRLTASAKGKRKVDTTAFFAAKPDTPAEARERVRRDLEAEERGLEMEMEERWKIEEAKRAATARGIGERGEGRRARLRRDWTYHEIPWRRVGDSIDGKEWLDKLMKEIPEWCAINSHSLPHPTSNSPHSLADLYLSLDLPLRSGSPLHPDASEPTHASEMSLDT